MKRFTSGSRGLDRRNACLGVPRRSTEPGRPRLRLLRHRGAVVLFPHRRVASLGCLDLSPNYQYEWVIDAKRSTRNHDMRRAALAAVDPLAAIGFSVDYAIHLCHMSPRTDEHLPTLGRVRW